MGRTGLSIILSRLKRRVLLMVLCEGAAESLLGIYDASSTRATTKGWLRKSVSRITIDYDPENARLIPFHLDSRRASVIVEHIELNAKGHIELRNLIPRVEQKWKSS